MGTYDPTLFTVIQAKPGHRFVVEYTQVGALAVEIGDFPSAAAAVNWITISSAGWLQKHEDGL
jgi:hypothetical protein